ncbi:MAG: hypothetical protein KDA85_05695 [Planctomycetaceae bacterium]|nr:hypothetical protein [Planctomycetaceae bacterium]
MISGIAFFPIEAASNRIRQSLVAAVATVLLVLSTHTADAGGARLIEVSDDQQTYTGKVAASNDATCCLMDRQGKLVWLNVKQLKSFRVVSDRFEIHSTMDFRQQLQA